MKSTVQNLAVLSHDFVWIMFILNILTFNTILISGKRKSNMALNVVSRVGTESTVILLLASNSSSKQNVEVDSHGGETNHPILLFRMFSAHTILQKPQGVNVIMLVYILSLWNKFKMHNPMNVTKKHKQNEQALHVWMQVNTSCSHSPQTLRWQALALRLLPDFWAVHVNSQLIAHNYLRMGSGIFPSLSWCLYPALTWFSFCSSLSKCGINLAVTKCMFRLPLKMI